MCEPACDVKNVVVTAYNGRISNPVLAAIGLGGRYDNTVFPAGVAACRELGTSGQLFPTGNNVLVGCQSIEHGVLAAHLTALYK